MNPWIAAAIGFVALLACCGVGLVRAHGLDTLLVITQLIGPLAALLFVVIAVAMHRTSFLDLGLAVAVLAGPSGLMFAHFVERFDP